MNEVLDTIMNRASVRRFRQQEIPQDTVHKIVRAGQQAPFTGQMYSVVATQEADIRQQLTECFGRLAQAPLFMLVCVDFYKLEEFIRSKGRVNQADDLSMLFLGIQDAAYFGQNMVLAAESMGLGSVFLGAAPWESDRLSDIFDLPERVYPLVGLVMGYPAEDPPPRPRIPTDLVLHWDRYSPMDDEDTERALKVMDAGLLREGYYKKLNARIPAEDETKESSYDEYGWSDHVSRKYGKRRRSFMSQLKESLARQGIDLE